MAGYPALCGECYLPVDLKACARAIGKGVELRHGCGRVLVMAKEDRWWERRV